MVNGPIFRSPDEVAEYRLSQAEIRGWKIMDSIEDANVKAQLFAYIETAEVPGD